MCRREPKRIDTRCRRQEEARRQRTDDGCGVLEAREVLGELGHTGAHELPQDGEVDGERCQVVREVHLGQHALHNVHHHLERVLLVALHHVQDERREMLKPWQ